MDELLGALDADFAGHEKLRLQLWNKTPKYGNDDEYADGILRAVFDAFHDEINGRPNTKGGNYRVNYLSTTCHVYFGSVTGATPDGRRAWEPLSDGISPAQGADRQGPTAVIHSAAKLDHARTGGTLLNQKFSPQLVEGESGLEHLAHLVRSYFKLDGHHIQFNVVTADTLARGAARAGKTSGSDCEGGGIQRLFLGFDAGAAGRNYRADGTDGVLEVGGLLFNAEAQRPQR